MFQLFLENPIYLIGTVITLLIAAVIHSSLKPKEKLKVDSKAFESLVDDGEWATEDGGKTRGGVVAPPPSAFTSGFLNPKKKVNKGPYKIGDRVMLRNLVSAKELNGRHGAIGDVWDDSTERYPVDLDLIDGTRGEKKKHALSVKAGNLVPEPELPSNEEEQRATVVNACLEESQGRTCAFIFKTLRGVASSIVNNAAANTTGANNNVNMTLPWKFWDAIPNRNGGLYEPIAEFLTRGILLKAKLQDLEKNLNPESPKGAYTVVTDAVRSELAVKSWNVRIEGQFWMMNITPEGTMVVSVTNPRQVYCVLGFQKPLGALGRFPRPPKVQLTLLPWYGRLVHDPMLASTTGTNQMELASPQMAGFLAQSVKLAVQEQRVIYRLRQLEVKGGSRVGVPYVPPVYTPPPPGQTANKNTANNATQQDYSKQKPATEQERAAVENLTEFDPILPQPQLLQQEQNPLGVWNFIRHDLVSAAQPNKEGDTNTEKPVTNSVMVLNARGQKIYDFTLSHPEPEALEILKAALLLCTKIGKRPLMFGVDDGKVANRLQFLLQGFKGMRIMLLKVEGKK